MASNTSEAGATTANDPASRASAATCARSPIIESTASSSTTTAKSRTDAAMLVALWQFDREELLAGLLLFRLLYYIVPFMLALIILGLREIFKGVSTVPSLPTMAGEALVGDEAKVEARAETRAKAANPDPNSSAVADGPKQ